MCLSMKFLFLILELYVRLSAGVDSLEDEANSWNSKGIGPPDWESDWLVMESQSEDYSYRVRRHLLGEVPWKVKVLIRIIAGTYAGYTFEAAPGGAMWDDDKPLPYCGVSYVYNNSTIKLFAPKATNDEKSGRIACAGGLSWGNGPKQEMVKARVKILAWLRSSFPKPDFISEWVSMNNTESFLEMDHNVTGDCSYMIVQIQGISISRHPGPWFAEAIGASQDPYDLFDRAAVVFGYSDSKVRIWKAYNNINSGSTYRKNPCFLCIRDGWTNDRRVTITSGMVRVIGWNTFFSSTHHVHREMLVDSENPDGVHRVPLFHGKYTVKPESLFISVQVKATSGPNKDFRFPAFGMAPAMPAESFTWKKYGGVVYGLTGSTLEIFLPSGPRGYPIIILPAWGMGIYSQTSKTAKVIINVIHRIKKDQIGGKCHFSQLNKPKKHNPLEVEREITCAQTCCEQPECRCTAYALNGTGCNFFRDLLQALHHNEQEHSVFVRK